MMHVKSHAVALANDLAAFRARALPAQLRGEVSEGGAEAPSDGIGGELDR